MAAKVGPKGQVVIEHRIRERLGVQPGMFALQELIDDHVEIRFLPAEHDRSLAGAARPFIRRRPSPDELEDLGSIWAQEWVAQHGNDASSSNDR